MLRFTISVVVVNLVGAGQCIVPKMKFKSLTVSIYKHREIVTNPTESK